jgi:hypothetical protein
MGVVVRWSNLAKPLTTWDSHVKLTSASVQAVTLLHQTNLNLNPARCPGSRIDVTKEHLPCRF